MAPCEGEDQGSNPGFTQRLWREVLLGVVLGVWIKIVFIEPSFNGRTKRYERLDRGSTPLGSSYKYMGML